MELHTLRNEIDKIDDEIVRLFCQRMEVSAHIADYKKANALPVYMPAREREKLADVAKKAGADMAGYTKLLYATLFELSRSYQNSKNTQQSHTFARICDAIHNTQPLFPQDAVVACQGAEGAYAQIACEKIFREPDILYFKNMEGIFQAVDQGLCQYGILPLENTAAGSMKKAYDLLIRYGFSIVRTFRLKTEHCLLANPGVKLSDVKEIYSHQHAIHQCSAFLNRFPDIKVFPVENTAVAAQMLRRTGKKDAAAICSRGCEAIYGLHCLASDVQDPDDPRTRFICISKKLEIYPGADRTSIRMILPQKPDALYRVLSRLYTLHIPVVKLESRSMGNQDLSLQYYFDLQTSVYSEEFMLLMCQLEALCEDFAYLGSYTEVV